MNDLQLFTEWNVFRKTIILLYYILQYKCLNPMYYNTEMLILKQFDTKHGLYIVQN